MKQNEQKQAKGQEQPNASMEDAFKKKLPKGMKRKMDSYNAGLSNLIHGKKTAHDVTEMLSSGDPAMAIPQTTLTLNGRMEQAMEERGELPDLQIRLSGGIFLVAELIEVGNAAGIFDINPEQEMAQYLEPAMKQYIEEGIASGKVDPVELQELVEPLMSDEEMSQGNEAGGAYGIPQKPGASAAMETYAGKKVRSAESKAKMQGQPQGPPQGQPQGPPQGQPQGPPQGALQQAGGPR